MVRWAKRAVQIQPRFHCRGYIYIDEPGPSIGEQAAEVVLDVVEHILTESELRQVAWSAGTVVGIINRVAEARGELTDRVAAARASASLWLEHPRLFAVMENPGG